MSASGQFQDVTVVPAGSDTPQLGASYVTALRSQLQQAAIVATDELCNASHPGCYFASGNKWIAGPHCMLRPVNAHLCCR